MCNCMVQVNKKWIWYIGFVKDKVNNETYIADHLARSKKGCSLVWKYPLVDDTQTIDKDQIIPVQVVGDWNTSKRGRFMSFKLKNTSEIIKEFDNLVKNNP